MAGQSGAPSTCQQPQAIVQKFRDAARAKRLHPCRRELNGECDAVELAAYVRDDRRFVIIEKVTASRRRRSIDEQANSRELQRVGGSQTRGRWRHIQRWEPIDTFTFLPQSLSAGGKNADFRSLTE
ncbi:hypothetical protein D3C71_1392310 [compost metagenome]